MAGRTLLVLAGGFGTRLRTAVADVPKPLAPVGGRPFLHYAIENWRRQGVGRLVLLLHHQAGLIAESLAAHPPLTAGLQIDVAVEPQPLGTGGAIAHAVRRCELAGTFMVANADTWLGSGIDALADAPAPAVGMVRVDRVERYGSLGVEGDRIVAFAEKASHGEESRPGSGWINAGLYRFDAGPFGAWDGSPFSLERDLLPTLAARGTLRGVPLDTDFIDIGVPQDYARFCRWMESGKAGSL